MRSVFSRRESFPTALAAALAPIFACLRPRRATQHHAVTDAAPPPLTSTYRYGDQGRLLSVATSVEPHNTISWKF